MSENDDDPLITTNSDGSINLQKFVDNLNDPDFEKHLTEHFGDLRMDDIGAEATGMMKAMFPDQEVGEETPLLDMMKTMLTKVAGEAPKEEETGTRTLNYLRQLYVEGNYFHLVYEDENRNICVWDETSENPDPPKYWIKFNDNNNNDWNVKRDVYKIKTWQPFFFLHSFEKEKWLSKFLDNDLAGYVLEFTDYFKENTPPEEVLDDFKKMIVETKILEKKDLEPRLLENLKYFSS
jgi:hypothetical protein